MRLFSRTDSFDILVLTSIEFKSDIETLSKFLNIPVKMDFHTISSGEEASSVRLRIFEYKDIQTYEKILYMDTDILIQNDLKPFFEYTIEDKLYALEELTINDEYHGNWFFDFTQIKKETPGFNAGVLLFKNSTTIKELFNEVLTHIKTRKQSGESMPECWEQPFLNYHTIRKNLCNGTFMKDYVFLTHKEYPISPLSNKRLILNHFYSKTSISKLKQMQYHFNHLFDIYKKIKPYVVEPMDKIQDAILYNQYVWDDGRILFHKENVIITSWNRGKYTIIGERIIEATWNNNRHVLLFNDTMDRFTWAHTSTLTIGYGTIDRSLKESIPSLSPIPNISKHLVYFCAFHNKGYIDLLQILLLSAVLFSNLDRIDILVFTSEVFRPLIEDLSKQFNITIHIQVFHFTTQHEAGCARLFIFDYTEIDLYDKILYMDTDIIVQNDISRFFDFELEDKVYAIEEYDISGEGHGAWFFDFTKFEKTTPALNSGVLLFQNTRKIRRIFSNIKQHIATLKESNSILPNCMDQSYIIYHLFVNNAYDSQKMKDYIYLSEKNPPPYPSGYSELTLIHFVWPIGNTENKKERMVKHLKNILNEYANICKQSDTIGPSTSLVGNSYSWEHGYIQFNDSMQLTTTWGPGTYKQFTPFIFEVNWGHHSHLLKFHSNYSSYISINKQVYRFTNGTVLP